MSLSDPSFCPFRRCRYMCCVEEQEGRPLFKVKVVEKGYDDLILTGSTPKGKHHLSNVTLFLLFRQINKPSRFPGAYADMSVVPVEACAHAEV